MDPKLLEILVCPVTKGPLVYDKEKQERRSKAARLAYPSKDGSPVMLEDEARRREPHEVECPAAAALVQVEHRRCLSPPRPRSSR